MEPLSNWKTEKCLLNSTCSLTRSLWCSSRKIRRLSQTWIFSTYMGKYMTRPQLRMFILARDNFACKYCGRSPMTEKDVVLQVDHKIPRKHGGLDDIDNLITSCRECNIGKSDIILAFWRESKTPPNAV